MFIPGSVGNQVWSFDEISWSRTGSFSSYQCNWPSPSPPPPPNNYGNGVKDTGEDYDPPSSAPSFSSISVDNSTCRWDFSSVKQLYCNGSCTWAGSSGFDQEDANILCRLITGNPNSNATSWEDKTALAEPGFPCAPLNSGAKIDIDKASRGIDYVNFDLRYQDSSILANHGAGKVIANPICT